MIEARLAFTYGETQRMVKVTLRGKTSPVPGKPTPAFIRINGKTVSGEVWKHYGEKFTFFASGKNEELAYPEGVAA